MTLRHNVLHCVVEDTMRQSVRIHTDVMYHPGHADAADRGEVTEMHPTLVINGDDCNGEAVQFAAWVQRHHPEIAVELYERTSGIGGGLYVGGELVDSDLWAEYCNE